MCSVEATFRQWPSKLLERMNKNSGCASNWPPCTMHKDNGDKLAAQADTGNAEAESILDVIRNGNNLKNKDHINRNTG